MADTRDAVIQKDLILKGAIRNGRRIDVYGYVEGQLVAETLHIHEGGRVFGTARVENAEIAGLLQGEAIVRNLISIATSGSVVGNIRYGRIALAPGGNLSAEVRNIPPQIAGDLEVAVRRGGSIAITTMDLTAVDPDDEATTLVFAISNAQGGWVARRGATRQPIEQFTEADIEAADILFVHDGSKGSAASFDVTVTDHAGASSGAPQTVRVAVGD